MYGRLGLVTLRTLRAVSGSVYRYGCASGFLAARLAAMVATIVAGRPVCLWLHAPEPIPENTELTLWLRGPKTYRGVIAERNAPTKNIEARFAVRLAGEYELHVEDGLKRTLLSDKITVGPGAAHTASCRLIAAEASPGGRIQLLRAFDAQGNAHVVGGVLFEAALGGAHCTVHDEGDGSYRIHLPPAALSGPHQLRLWQPSEGEVAVVELPIFLMRPAEKPPASATCTLVGQNGRVGRPLELIISLFDAQGAPASATNPAVTFRALLGEQEVELQPAAEGSSRSSVTFCPSSPSSPGTTPGTTLGSSPKSVHSKLSSKLSGCVVPTLPGIMGLCIYVLPNENLPHQEQQHQGQRQQQQQGQGQPSTQLRGDRRSSSRASIDPPPSSLPSSAMLLCSCTVHVRAPLPTPCSATLSLVDLDASARVMAGEPHTLRLQLNDEIGKPCAADAHAPRIELIPHIRGSHGVAVAAAAAAVASSWALAGTEGTSLLVESQRVAPANGPGTYELTYVPIRTGTYELRVRIGPRSASSGNSDGGGGSVSGGGGSVSGGGGSVSGGGGSVSGGGGSVSGGDGSGSGGCTPCPTGGDERSRNASGARPSSSASSGARSSASSGAGSSVSSGARSSVSSVSSDSSSPTEIVLRGEQDGEDDQAEALVLAADANTTLGPWRIDVGPARFCLKTSLSAATLPAETLEVGSTLAVCVPLLDRFGNWMRPTEAGRLGSLLSAALVRVQLLLPSAVSSAVEGSDEKLEVSSPRGGFRPGSSRGGFRPGSAAHAASAGRTPSATPSIDSLGVTKSLGRPSTAARRPSTDLSIGFNRRSSSASDATLPSASTSAWTSTPHDGAYDGALERLECSVVVCPWTKAHAAQLPSPPSASASAHAPAPSMAMARPVSAAPCRSEAAASRPVGTALITAPTSQSNRPKTAGSMSAVMSAAERSARGAVMSAPDRSSAAGAPTTAPAAGAPPTRPAQDGAFRCLPPSDAIAALVTFDALVAGDFTLALACTADDTTSAAAAAATAGRLTVQAGALDASQCIGEGPGLRACVLGETADFSITPRDANGYVRRMARGAPFRVCCINGAAHIEFAVEARIDGSYGIRYTPCGRKGEQLLILAVTFAGKPIRGSPFRVAVVESPSIAYALETALVGHLHRDATGAVPGAIAPPSMAPTPAPVAAVTSGRRDGRLLPTAASQQLPSALPSVAASSAAASSAASSAAASAAAASAAASAAAASSSTGTGTALVTNATGTLPNATGTLSSATASVPVASAVQQWVRHYCAATASSAALAEVQQVPSVRVPTRLSPHQQPLSMHLLTTAPAVPTGARADAPREPAVDRAHYDAIGRRGAAQGRRGRSREIVVERAGEGRPIERAAPPTARQPERHGRVNGRGDPVGPDGSPSTFTRAPAPTRRAGGALGRAGRV